MIDVSPFVDTLPAGPVAVFGLARSGTATVGALRAAGAQVWAWDDGAGARAAVGACLRDLYSVDWAEAACLVLAPGVPPDHPVPSAARAAGCAVIGDLEVLHRCAHGRRTIGITGTNGKSTTTALTAHILRAAGRDVACGGNIGAPALGLEMPAPGGVFVLEVSSFQAELCPTFRPDAAALLNLEPDHLARHGDMASYVAAKERLLEGPGLAVIGADDPESRAVADRARKAGARDVLPISAETQPAGGFWVTGEGGLVDGRAEPVEVARLARAQALRGNHNHQNAAAAAALSIAGAGVEPGVVAGALESWGGLPHRQYLVRTIDGVGYLDDSKATNVAAAQRALAAFAPIYWIAGGQARKADLEPLVPYLESVRHVFLIGEAAPALAEFLDRNGVAHTDCRALGAAVAAAHAMAQENRGAPGGAGVVLLAPAYQSFDQFASFEDRGEQFCALVSAL